MVAALFHHMVQVLESVSLQRKEKQTANIPRKARAILGYWSKYMLWWFNVRFFSVCYDYH